MPGSTKVDELRRDCTLRFNGRVEGERELKILFLAAKTAKDAERIWI